jgi:hypothetical protein
MAEVNCFIMDNLLGKDFNNIVRIYDLKGSTKGRIVPLTPQEMQQESTGLQVLKDLNYTSLKERIEIGSEYKSKLLTIIEKDAQFLA